jgi:hypothetical protein
MNILRFYNVKEPMQMQMIKGIGSRTIIIFKVYNIKQVRSVICADAFYNFFVSLILTKNQSESFRLLL